MTPVVGTHVSFASQPAGFPAWSGGHDTSSQLAVQIASMSLPIVTCWQSRPAPQLVGIEMSQGSYADPLHAGAGGELFPHAAMPMTSPTAIRLIRPL